MTSFTSPIGPTLDRFLRHKRALGYGYRREEGHLRALDCLAKPQNTTAITESFVREYLASKPRRSRPNCLTVVRQLARFVALESSDVFVPPTRFLGTRRDDAPIRLLSRRECARFLDACDNLPASSRWPQRSLIHGAALRTLLLTGMRRGEVVRLKCRDVDLELGIVSVIESKFGKSRFVPIAPDLLQKLREYNRSVRRSTRAPKPSDAFFPGPDGRRPNTAKKLYESFRRALAVAGIAHHGRSRGPRCHDLRHAFAVLRLLSWYEHGEDLAAKLPLLATYLGHVGIAELQVYLHMTRDFVGEIVKRQHDRFGDLITVG